MFPTKIKIKIYTLIVFCLVFTGANVFAQGLGLGQNISKEDWFKHSPALLLHNNIEEAGIPIYGVAFDEGKVQRVTFRETATNEQMQKAWEIVNNFDYEKELAKIKSGEGLVTAYGSKIPELTEDGQISVATVNGMPYVYFQADGETHHIMGSSSFEISPKETIDALSGEKMQVGDFVIGMIDRSLENGKEGEESSLHGVWVKWSSVKAELIKEIKASGGLATIEGVDGSLSIVEKVTNALASLGVKIKDGIFTVASLATEKLFAKTARIQRLEMEDKATGEIWCTWVENGEWYKEKGECDALEGGAITAPSQEIQEIIEEPAAVEPEPEEVIEETVEEVVEEVAPEEESVVEEPTVVEEEPVIEEQPVEEFTPEDSSSIIIEEPAPEPEPEPAPEPEPELAPTPEPEPEQNL